MAGYRVTRDYRAVYRSQSIGFTKGDTVDVDAATAEWVNRDSPGCLVGKNEPAPEPEPVEEPVKRAAKKRASRAGA